MLAPSTSSARWNQIAARWNPERSRKIIRNHDEVTGLATRFDSLLAVISFPHTAPHLRSVFLCHACCCSRVACTEGILLRFEVGVCDYIRSHVHVPVYIYMRLHVDDHHDAHLVNVGMYMQPLFLGSSQKLTFTLHSA